MPYRSDEGRYPHLELVREGPAPERRRPRAPPPNRPDRGGREQFGPQLRTRVEQIERQAALRPPPPAGIQPHLVFRVPIVAGASGTRLVERIEAAGMAVVGIDPDGAIVAFSDDSDLTRFQDGIDRYLQGPGARPDGGQFQSTTWDVLEVIDVEHMRVWGRSDRVGRRLADLIGLDGERIDDGTLYVVDLELWHRGTVLQARESLQEVRRLIGDATLQGERVRDEFVGDLLCLAKVSVRGAKLNSLLDLDVIAEVDLPPIAVFDLVAAREATAREFPPPPRPPENGPRVCIVDSGIAPGHPLLEANVGHYESILTTTESGTDDHGHGTMVAGIATFGDVRAAYEAGHFESELTVFSARVLNEANGFDDERLIVRQMELAIERFKAEPHRCRVFNLSLGADGPWFRDNRRQSVWAECLDTIARTHKVLLVVSAGNQHLGAAHRASDAEDALATYPRYLFDEECGLCEPATAAIAVTVGGTAQHDLSGVRQGSSEDSINIPIATAGQPTPTTRIGPGLGGAIKPEFVAPAGNGLFDGFSSAHRVIRPDDGGLAVMSFAHDWVVSGSLFQFSSGTSFAAPRVSRLAAITWRGLEEVFREDVDPNTVRAVLATAASPPSPTVELITPFEGEEGVRRVCGYGEIDEDFALNSGDSRVTLVAQGRITLDSFLIYALPIPEEFRAAPGRKRVIVGLAYDPPVRRRRAKYLGVEMDVLLHRGMSIEEIVESYRALTPEDREAAETEGRAIPGTPQDARRCRFTPGPTILEGSTLHRCEWIFSRSEAQYGDTYFLVVRAKRGWAPETITEQDFGLAVTLATDAEVRLYDLIQLRVRQRIRV